LPGRWAALAVIWPPFFQGLWVGNVAVPALALFALGPWFGSGLTIGAAFKSYTGIATLWLVKERRWLDVVVGVGALVVAVVATLPLTGTDLWFRWLDGLRIYQTSQSFLATLYGFGLPRYIPFPVYIALAAAAVVAAFFVRGRDSLARFGTATIVASPSLFSHGMLVAVPSMLSLRSPWLWLTIGLLSPPSGEQWWYAVVVIALSWVVPSMRRPDMAGASPADGAATASPAPAELLHPLGADGVSWPGPAGARS